MSGELIFEDPPATGGRYKQAVWRAPLMARPGEWARLPLSWNATGVLRQRHPAFEFTSRTVDGDRRVYGRYIGEDGEHR